MVTQASGLDKGGEATGTGFSLNLRQLHASAAYPLKFIPADCWIVDLGHPAVFGSERGQPKRRDWSDSGRYDWTNTRRTDWPHLYRSGAQGHIGAVDTGALAFSPGTTGSHYAKRHDQRDDRPA